MSTSIAQLIDEVAGTIVGSTLFYRRVVAVKALCGMSHAVAVRFVGQNFNN